MPISLGMGLALTQTRTVGEVVPAFRSAINGLSSNAIYGTAAEIGTTLIGNISNLKGDETIVHRWQDTEGIISGADASIYTVVAGQDTRSIWYTPTVDGDAVDSTHYNICYAAPVSGTLLAINTTVGTVFPVNLAAAFTGGDLTYTSNQTWATVFGSTLTIVDEERTGTVTITASNSGGLATVDLWVTVIAASVAVNPSLVLAAQEAGASGSPDRIPITYSYEGADDVDLYAATGASDFAITEGNLIAGFGGAGVEFDSQIGYTGGVIDLNGFTDDTVAEVAIVAVERGNGGTSGIQRIALTDIDFTALNYTSAVVIASNANTLTITLDDDIYGITTTADWALAGNTITDASFVPGGSLVELSLGTAVNGVDDFAGDLTYTGTKLTDERGNTLLGFSGEDVTNNVPASGAVADTFTVGSDTAITSYVGESGLAYTSPIAANMTVNAATGRLSSNPGATGSRYAQRGAATYTNTWNASGTLVYGSDPSAIHCTCVAICTIDSGNFYFARHSDGTDAIDVVRVGGVGGTAVITSVGNIATTYSFSTGGNALEVGLDYDGETMQLLLNGVVVATVSESAHQAGGVGVYTRDGAASGVLHELANFKGGGS